MERGGALLVTRGQLDGRISRQPGLDGDGWPWFSTGDRLSARRLRCGRRGIRGGTALAFSSGHPVGRFPGVLGRDDLVRKVRKISPPIQCVPPASAGPFAEFALSGIVVDNCNPSRGYDHHPLSMLAPMVRELDPWVEFDIKVFATARTERSADRFRRALGAMTADVREKP